MRHYLYTIFLFLLISNCTLNKVTKHHGVHFLEKKQNNLTINTSNKNDIIELLGPPSTKSTFNKDLLIYIERTTSSSKVLKLGKKTLIKNDVLILEINNKGLLSKKIFFNKEDMNNIEFSKNFTEMSYTNQSFLYDFLSSVRQKMNDPLGKKNK
jgi:outer membrane protein assembly factor BamE (lipoprotein component of BamABCDE complex)|tara:strand:+ start:54 stop:515 length:462 start_codon:yes stop_codon:yes gene_type:complete